MLSDYEYREVWMAAETRPLTAIWSYSEPESSNGQITFSERKNYFFWLLERLLREDRIKLAKHGKFLEGTVDEQVERFRQAFPATEAEMEDGIWFFDEACPGGAVWVLEDGSLAWS